MSSTPIRVSNAPLDDQATTAVRAAGDQHDGAVSTLDLLRALIDLDDRGRWSWVQLRATYVSAEDAKLYRDPASGAPGRWERVPLTSSALDAFACAERLSVEYEISPIPSGLLALGLVWDAECAAAQSLLSGSDLTHEQLLHEIEDSVLETTLDGLLDKASRGRRTTSQAQPQQDPRQAAQRPSGWEADWQLLETPATRRFDYHNKIEAVVTLVLVSAFCLCLCTVLASRFGAFAILLIPLGLALTFVVGTPRRSPLTSVLRIAMGAALSSWTLAVIALLLMISEAVEYYYFMPRNHAIGHGGRLLSAKETARLRVEGLSEVKRFRAGRVLDLMSKGGLERALMRRYGTDADTIV